MEENRRGVILGFIALLTMFFVIYITQVIAGYMVNTFYWGLSLGLLFGLVTCLYLNEAWDPEFLEPTNPETEKASMRLLWVVPLGTVTASITAKYFSVNITYLLSGIIFSWLSITIGYMAIQAWRYRPK